MSQFEADIRIRSFQVDINKNLSIPSLLGINQERAIHHTEMLGYGKEKTLDGYMGHKPNALQRWHKCLVVYFRLAKVYDDKHGSKQG